MPDRDLVRRDRPPQPATSPKGTNYLLAISIKDYQHCTKLTKEPFTPMPDGHDQGNGTALNFKLRWVILSIVGFVLILLWGNKVIGLFSGGDEKAANQLSKELRSKFSYSMVLIPAGEFQMGTNYIQTDSYPIHKVSLSGFYLGKTEVTQAQWRAVMGSDPPELSFKGCDKCPVESVSWYDVQKFIKKLNLKTGGNYRLPTEAEWEYAAKGGPGQAYMWRNNLDAIAWYGSNAGGKTHPVGQKKTNQLGLYDMRGNVAEWCQDWHDSNYYANSPSRNPQGPNTGFYKVFRGGSWRDSPDLVRVNVRVSGTPRLRYNPIGFRLAKQKPYGIFAFCQAMWDKVRK
jgi:formylglycine-generating enzyme required for sulfatase activity